MRRSFRMCRVVAAVLVLAGSLLAAPPAHAAAPTRLMVVGDSISHGSASDYTWRYRLARHLGATAPGAVDFVGDRTDLYDNIAGASGSQAYIDGAFDRQHHALWGRPVAYEKDTIAAAVRSAQADVMTVLLGINDLAWLGQSPAGLAADMETLIRNARSANPGVDIVLGHLLTRGDLWGRKILDASVTADVNRRYDELAVRLSTTASRIVTASTEAGWNPIEHTWDGVHPNPTGEVVVARGMADALSRLGIGRAYGAVPDFVRWDVGGGTVTATAGDRSVTLRWNRTPGANAVYIEQRLVSLGETTFKPLPVPLSGTSWTAEPLAPGWVIEYRVVPMKGVIVGHGGPTARVTVLGTVPTGHSVLAGSPGADQHTATLRWTRVANASGYYIEMCDLVRACPADSSRWDRLPWPIADPGTTFSPGALAPGHWYAFRIRPVNGALLGPVSNTVEVRTKGVPLYSDYYALGDSFSAGTGAGGYEAGDPTCLRSEIAWPRKIPAGWEPEPHLRACAGKLASHVKGEQLTWVSDHPPSGQALVTVTMGGNDANFFPTLLDCLGTATCTGHRAEISARINDYVRYQVRDALRAIRDRLPGADILAVGYPLLIAPPGDGCWGWSEVTLTDSDKVMMRDLTAQLNDAVHWAAQQAGVMSAAYDPASWFRGHEACAGQFDSEAWINKFTTPVLTSFHPNSTGQQGYAYAVNYARTLYNNTGMARPAR